MAVVAAGLCVAFAAWLARSYTSGTSHTPSLTQSPGTQAIQDGQRTSDSSTAPGGESRSRVFGQGSTLALDSGVSPIRFANRAVDLGVAFRQTSGITRDKHFPAANGSGVGILDFDADGLQDIYLLTACPLPVSITPLSPRNSLMRRTADGVYEDVGPSAGVDLAAFCQGVTVGDINNDGFSDFLIVALGGNRVYLNHGDGTYSDMSDAAGIVDQRWGASAAFIDYDEDGSLDFYVANYGLWSLESNLYCGDQQRDIRVFCRPTYITPDVHSLYRNRGDGSFEWATERAGIARSDGRGQGVVAADVNNDGHVDLYVGNDISPHFLFLGRGDGTFQDYTELSGAAYDADGRALAGMGVDATDLDGDGLPELFATHFANEFNTLYHNLGSGFFEDIAALSGLGPDSLPDVGWGTMLADLDNDGLADVLVVNGHVDDNLAELGGDEPYRQRARVWRNRGRLRFEQLTDRAGDYFASAHVSRGAAFGDLDDDGRLDAVVCNLDDETAVLMNESEAGAGWVRFRLIGRRSNRDAIGCLVQSRSGSLQQWRAVKGGASYLSAHDLRVLIGVGDAAQVDEVTVTWPNRTTSILNGVELRRTYTLAEPIDAGQK
jgi:hypothetical protein